MTGPQGSQHLPGRSVVADAEYMRRYRAEHPEYVQRQRDASRERQRRLRADPESSSKIREQGRAYYKLRSEQDPQYGFKRSMRMRYSMTLEDREALLASQGGRCAMSFCRREIRFKEGSMADGAHIDHCHKTGRVRGVLCAKCNMSLGFYKDDPERLRAAAAYLEKDTTS